MTHVYRNVRPTGFTAPVQDPGDQDVVNALAAQIRAAMTSSGDPDMLVGVIRGRFEESPEAEKGSEHAAK